MLRRQPPPVPVPTVFTDAYVGGWIVTRLDRAPLHHPPLPSRIATRQKCRGHATSAVGKRIDPNRVMTPQSTAAASEAVSGVREPRLHLFHQVIKRLAAMASNRRRTPSSSSSWREPWGNVGKVSSVRSISPAKTSRTRGCRKIDVPDDQPGTRRPLFARSFPPSVASMATPMLLRDVTGLSPTTASMRSLPCEPVFCARCHLWPCTTAI